MLAVTSLSFIAGSTHARTNAFVPTFGKHVPTKNLVEDPSITRTITRKISSTKIPMYFDFKDDPIIIPEETYDQVLESTLPGCTTLSIRKSVIGHGHGLFSRTSFLPESEAFTIPAQKCITLNDVKNHPDLGEVLTIMIDDLGEEEGPLASLAAFLASEMLREQCAEWEEDPSLSGPYADYIKCLPTGRAVSEQDHVLWWSHDEVSRLFEGGAAYEKAMALRDWVETEGEIIEGMLVSDLAQKMMGLSVQQVRGAVTNAFVNVLNRSLFNDSDLQRLVPVLDMCAHSSSPNLKHEVDSAGNVVVTPTRPIMAGEELTLDYYSSEFEGHEWYVMYGFIVPFGKATAYAQ